MKKKPVAARFLQQARTSVLLCSLTGVLAGSSACLAASPSDLLEKAIYSEQTKGDIDQAMTLSLRGNIEPDLHHPQFIHTIRDIGYRFEPSDEKTNAKL